MEIETILTILKDYDLPTIMIGVFVYLHINKKLSVVDKAVNNRAPESLTMSQEVSEIHRKVDVSATKADYMIKELDAHRDVDEKAFLEIGKDIKGLHKRVSDIKKQA
jgi:hypothetical protein